MGTVKTFFILCLLVLNFIGVIFLIMRLGGIPYYLEIIYVLVALLVSLVILLGIAFDAGWAWPLATILFAVNMANAVCLYLVVGAMLTFILLILFNSIGILTSVLSVSDEEDEFEPVAEPVETYNAKPEKESGKAKKRMK